MITSTVVAAFFLGVLVTMLFMGRTSRRTFLENVEREFNSIFLDRSGLNKVRQVLHMRAEALRVAYIALDTYRRRNESGHVWPTRSDNLFNKVVTERDLYNAIDDAHWSYDRAVGLAYLNGHGRIADSVKKVLVGR